MNERCRSSPRRAAGGVCGPEAVVNSSHAFATHQPRAQCHRRRRAISSAPPATAAAATPPPPTSRRRRRRAARCAWRRSAGLLVGPGTFSKRWCRHRVAVLLLHHAGAVRPWASRTAGRRRRRGFLGEAEVVARGGGVEDGAALHPAEHRARFVIPECPAFSCADVAFSWGAGDLPRGVEAGDDA